MNRIYQGRVSKVEVPTGNQEDPWKPLDHCKMPSGSTTTSFGRGESLDG